MPNNGIVSTKTNIPEKFRAANTSEFDTATDMVVVNKALDGINVTQKSVTIDQLGELVASSQSPTTFNVSTSGAIIISKNEGDYGNGPETIADGDSLSISNVELPSGLTWMGLYSSGTEYSNADVVYSIVSGLYTTWVYINATPTTGQALPSGGATFNTYWAQLGTQGPAGSIGYKSIILKIRTTSGGNFSSLPVFTIINTIYDDSGLTYLLGSSMIATNVSTQCIVPINFSSTFNTSKIYATGISNSAAQPLDIIASIADNDTIYYHIKQMDDPLEPIDVPAGFQFSVEIRIYN